MNTPLVLRNPTQPAGEALPPPLKDNGSAYRFEMVYDAGKWRAYADDADTLLAALIRHYNPADATAALAHRIHHAVRTQTTMQAILTSAHDLNAVTADEYAVLMASRATAPDITRWDAPIPLILVDTFYAPHAAAPCPATEPGSEDLLIWLRPTDPLTYLLSLHDLGAIALHEHLDFRP